MRVSTSTQHLMRSTVPVAGAGTSQIREVPSADPVRAARPSGRKATLVTRPSCSRTGLIGLAGGKVPDSGRAVSGAHEHRAAVRRDGQVHDQALKQDWRCGSLTGGGIPEAQGLVPAAADEQFAIGTERQAPERALVL